jgi:hypothetical protein
MNAKALRYGRAEAELTATTGNYIAGGQQQLPLKEERQQQHAALQVLSVFRVERFIVLRTST